MFRQLGNFVGYVSDKPSRRGIAVGVLVLCFGSIEIAVHETLARLDLPLITSSLLDGAVVGLSFGFAVWMLLRGNYERRRRVRQDLERLSMLNHEIRNALQVITHSHFDADVKHRAMVMESVARIDSVLKRVYPAVGGSEPPHSPE